MKCVLGGSLSGRITAGALGSSLATWRYSVKIGDLVKWGGLHSRNEGWSGERSDTGIIVDGPRDEEAREGSDDEDSPATSYAVAWFDAKTTFWHLDFNLELLSENR